MPKCVGIERTHPRPGGVETPAFSLRGYELGSPLHGGEKHLVENATFVGTLDEAAALIAEGYSLRMGRPGKRASMISPGKLRVIWA